MPIRELCRASCICASSQCNLERNCKLSSSIRGNQVTEGLRSTKTFFLPGTKAAKQFPLQLANSAKTFVNVLQH